MVTTMIDPYYSDDNVTIYHADCLDVLDQLEADVIVTDPPYGRAWAQGDTNSALGWASDRHEGIAGDDSTATRDAVLAVWADRPGIVFGDLMLLPPDRTKLVLVYDKGTAAGFTGAVGGYRRNVEAVYLTGKGHGSGLGGRSSVLQTVSRPGGNLAATTGHPHTKPLDVMRDLIVNGPDGVILDPFMGSGTTLRAAKDLGRKAVGVEISEEYCEIAANRVGQEVLALGV